MTAREYAATLSTESGVRWRALEVAAFAAYPSVLRQLDPRGKYSSGSRRGGTRPAPPMLALAIPAILLLGAMFLAPVAGLTTLIGDRFGTVHPDPVVAVPVASVIFLCTLPLLAVSFITWRRGGSARDPLREYQAGMLAVLGAASVVVALVRSDQEGFASGRAWAAGIALPALLGAAFWVALLLARRSTRQAVAPLDRSVAVEPLRRVREAIERLPVDEQRLIRADLTAAIDDLSARGIIHDADVDRARTADLGKLALRMSQGSRSGG